MLSDTLSLLAYLNSCDYELVIFEWTFIIAIDEFSGDAHEAVFKSCFYKFFLSIMIQCFYGKVAFY